MWLANRLFPSVRRLQARLAELERKNGKRQPIETHLSAEHRAFRDKFIAMLLERPPGLLLEIGARNRTSPDRKPPVPPGWRYEGLDVAPDVWVTIIGDAHNLSLQRCSVDAIFSGAVFEHLLMPWKVALEMNLVLRIGGLAYVSSHQTFPLHEMPADYWRFSANAWRALFNKDTGFRIIETKMIGPAKVVADVEDQTLRDLHTLPAYLLSMMIAQKTHETILRWDVDPHEVWPLEYPR